LAPSIFLSSAAILSAQVLEHEQRNKFPSSVSRLSFEFGNDEGRIMPGLWEKSFSGQSSLFHHVCRQIVSGYSLVALPPPHPPPTARMIQAKWIVEIFPTRRFPHRFPRNHSLWLPTHG